MGERGREELETTSPVLYSPMNRECSMKENSDRKKRTINGFTISVSVLILPAFQQLLLRNKIISSISLVETSERSVQTADNKSKFTSQAPQVTLVLFIFKLIFYFNSSIISNQIKYYLAINTENFLQIQYGFYRQALTIHYQL